MTYQLSKSLFVENGAALAAATARARRASLDAFYLAEAARLAAAGKVIGTDLRKAA